MIVQIYGGKVEQSKRKGKKSELFESYQAMLRAKYKKRRALAANECSPSS
jgi:hypothetical protein